MSTLISKPIEVDRKKREIEICQTLIGDAHEIIKKILLASVTGLVVLGVFALLVSTPALKDRYVGTAYLEMFI